MFFERPGIALTIVVEKMYSCLISANCTRNCVITCKNGRKCAVYTVSEVVTIGNRNN